MEFAYNDIIGLRRPAHDGDAFSRRHPKMAQLNRAKIFAPFAALAVQVDLHQQQTANLETALQSSRP